MFRKSEALLHTFSRDSRFIRFSHDLKAIEEVVVVVVVVVVVDKGVRQTLGFRNEKQLI